MESVDLLWDGIFPRSQVMEEKCVSILGLDLLRLPNALSVTSCCQWPTSLQSVLVSTHPR